MRTSTRVAAILLLASLFAIPFIAFFTIDLAAKPAPRIDALPRSALQVNGLTHAGLPGLNHVLLLTIDGDKWAWLVKGHDEAHGLVAVHRCNRGQIAETPVWLRWSEVGHWEDLGHIDDVARRGDERRSGV